MEIRLSGNPDYHPIMQADPCVSSNAPSLGSCGEPGHPLLDFFSVYFVHISLGLSAKNESQWGYNYYTPASTKLKGGILVIPPLQLCWRGVYWSHLVRLSVCGQNRVRSVSSTILAGSISYLHILSTNFMRCVALRFLEKFKIWILAISLKL